MIGAPVMTPLERAQIAALPVARRTEVCPRVCRSLRAFRVAYVEIRDHQIVRWWCCPICGFELALNVLARETRS